MRRSRARAFSVAIACSALAASTSCTQDRFSARATSKLFGPEGGTLVSPEPKDFHLTIEPGVLETSIAVWIHEDTETYVRRGASPIYRIEPGDFEILEGASVTMFSFDGELLLARVQDPRPVPLAGQTFTETLGTPGRRGYIHAPITRFGSFILFRETCREVSRLRDAGVLPPALDAGQCPDPPPTIDTSFWDVPDTSTISNLPDAAVTDI